MSRFLLKKKLKYPKIILYFRCFHTLYILYYVLALKQEFYNKSDTRMEADLKLVCKRPRALKYINISFQSHRRSLDERIVIISQNTRKQLVNNQL